VGASPRSRMPASAKLRMGSIKNAVG